MDKLEEGYITLEASLIFPIVILILYLLITSSLTLFVRCFDSQTEYMDELIRIRIGASSLDQGLLMIYDDLPYEERRNAEGMYYINPLRRIVKEWNEY